MISSSALLTTIHTDGCIYVLCYQHYYMTTHGVSVVSDGCSNDMDTPDDMISLHDLDG